MISKIKIRNIKYTEKKTTTQQQRSIYNQKKKNLFDDSTNNKPVDKTQKFKLTTKRNKEKLRNRVKS